MHWQTSFRVTNSSAERSHTALPSSVANGFFSRSLNRVDCPAAGRITLNLAMFASSVSTWGRLGRTDRSNNHPNYHSPLTTHSSPEILFAIAVGKTGSLRDSIIFAQFSLFS